MLEPNNPDLDADVLAERIRQETRRRKPRAPGSLFAVAPDKARGVAGMVSTLIDVRAWKHRIGAIPLLGPLARWTYALLGISRLKLHVLSALEQLFTRQAALTSRQDAFAAQLQQVVDGVSALRNNDIAQLRGDFEQRLAYLHQELRLLQRSALASQAQANAHADARPAPVAADLQSGMLDAFYAAFEDSFRGSRGDIKSRLEVYLPYIRKAGAGTHDAPILDIGCGRGEWLELLGERGLVCSGVDLNTITVQQCRSRGFNVAQTDALNHLASQPNDSIGALTGFHIVEHLPFEQLLALFDEALRVLRPGGVLVFETPNPENLLVGAQTFYNDPTHRAPLPPPLTEFLARQRGFAGVEILRLHPHTPEHHAADSSKAGVRLNELLYGPQDYALIAWKSSHAA